MRNPFRKPKGTGALEDTRPLKEKEKDYWFKEIVASADIVDWKEKPQSEWRKFPIFNQNGSGSCVAQTTAKLLGIMYAQKNAGEYVHFSATHIYQRRSNKPMSGMMGVEAFTIAQEGATLEDLVPSQNLTDTQMDGAIIPKYKQDVGAVFKISNFVTLPTKDIDTVASTIQKTGKGVMVWFYLKIDEWTNAPAIKYSNLDQYGNVARHSVTAVDFTMYQGEKALIIEDSWGTSYGLAGQRIIKESFYKERNLFAAYPLTFKFEEPADPVTPKPKYTFTKSLSFGISDPDVKVLQDILKYEGIFPINTDSTGYYGALTAKSILAWQKKHQVAPDAELDALAGKSVGAKTIAKLNSLYGA